MTVLRAACVWLCLFWPGQSLAQDTLLPIPILIVDSERLFAETEYGRRIADDLAQLAAAFQEENDRIVESLTQEERSLTVRRPQMAPEDFRAEAEAFDQKVQEVRRVRDAKNVELQTASAEARSTFEQRVQPILGSLMLEKGAVMIIEQRTALLSVRAANITDAAIALIDERLGDGTQ